MFGPKFAPIKQIQYLYIPDGNVKSFEDLEGHLPQQAVVLFITKFEGIPMADVFKVLQYWIIDQNPHHEASPSPVAELGRSAVYLQVGVAIHYVKSSLFKSQILSGTRDEVTPQIKKYVLYAQLRAAEYKRALDQDGFQALETDIAIVDAARRRYSGTISHAVVESAAAAAAATAATTPVASIPSVASMEPHPNLELVTYVAWVIGVVIALFCGWYLLSTHRQVSLLIKQVDQLQQALLENTKLLQTVLEKQNNLCS